MIDQLIKKLANNSDTRAMICTVSEIDVASNVCVCSPINGDADILEVRLKASMDGDKGMVIVPADGSYVIVDFIEQLDHAYIAMTSEVDQVIINIVDKQIKVDNKGLSLSGGNVNLKDEILALYGIINDILTELLIFKVNTPVGPSVSVFPDNMVKLQQYKVNLKVSENKIKTILG
jgi:hypothetical protein